MAVLLGPGGGAPPDGAAAEATTAARAGRLSLALALAVSVLVAGLLIWRTRFDLNGEVFYGLFDDALISMRFARNLAGGHGLVWNVGQAPVEGYTNFLWTIWMAVLHLSSVSQGQLSLLIKLSGGLTLLLNLLIVRALARRLVPAAPLLAELVGWSTTLSYTNVVWAVGGLEVGLVTLQTSAAVLLALQLRQRYQLRTLGLLGLVLSSGLLTRTDYLVVAVVVVPFTVWSVPARQRWRVGLILGLATVGTLMLHTGFRLVYYGDPLPNTYYLKLQGAPFTVRLARGLSALVVLGVVSLYLPVALAFAAFFVRRGRLQPGAGLLALVVLGQCAYSVYVGGDAWEFYHYANRYIAPSLPALLMLSLLGSHAVLGLDRAAARGRCQLFALALLPLYLLLVEATRRASRAIGDETWVTVRIVCVALCALLILLLPYLQSGVGRLAWFRPGWLDAPRLALVGLTLLAWVAMNGEQVNGRLKSWGDSGPGGVSAYMARYGRALRDATAPDAVIAVVWAGGIPYFSDRPSIDLLGKSDAVVARGVSRVEDGGLYPGHDKWNYPYSIGQLRPDLVAQIWQSNDAVLRALEGWGYVRVHPQRGPNDLYVRADSTRVDLPKLRRWLCGGQDC